MKKKLLSLLMAGAVVAGTTMPAFAATYNEADTSEINAPVKITGTVHDSKGSAPAGRIEVEIPTALSFTVDTQGRLTAGNFEIKNNSKADVDVKVGSFRETQVGGGITLWNDNSGFDTKDRSNICLVLRHGQTDVVLQHNMQEKKLATIPGNSTSNVQVLGVAGTAQQSGSTVDDAGVNETFDLVFKITKNPLSRP